VKKRHVKIVPSPDNAETLDIMYGEIKLATVDEYESVSLEVDCGHRNQRLKAQIEDGVSAIYELVDRALGGPK
jgi:hypothetical protein